MTSDLVMRQIGVARTPFLETRAIPKGPGAEHTTEGTLEIDADLDPGLLDIEGFSHLYVLWAFHRAGGFDVIARLKVLGEEDEGAGRGHGAGEEVA